MNFRQVEVFYAVMTEGGITAAARKLGISQPSVSTTIKQAEDKLGFMLFEREGSRLLPTAGARILFEEAGRAHQALDSINLLSDKLRDGIAHHVRVAATASLCLEIVPNALALFSEKHPQCSVDVSTNNTDAILQSLDARSGTHHIGFTFGKGNYQGLSSSTMGQIDLYCLIPASWNMNHGSTVELNKLDNKPYVSAFPTTPLGVAVDSLFLASQIKPKTIATVHSHPLALELVVRGLGFAILDSITVHSLLNSQYRDAVSIHKIHQSAQVPVTAIFPSGRLLSNPSRYFVDGFKGSLAQLLTEVKQSL